VECCVLLDTSAMHVERGPEYVDAVRPVLGRPLCWALVRVPASRATRAPQATRAHVMSHRCHVISCHTVVVTYTYCRPSVQS
jgi:hypothetical protein